MIQLKINVYEAKNIIQIGIICLVYSLITISGTLAQSAPGTVKKSDFIWRSILVPGWGQFHNKEITKGIVFLGGTLALTGTAIYFESQRSTQIRKANETLNINLKRTFKDRSKKWETARNITGIAAIGIYLWNIIDAAVGNSNQYVKVKSQKYQFFVQSNSTFDEVGIRYCF